MRAFYLAAAAAEEEKHSFSVLFLFHNFQNDFINMYCMNNYLNNMLNI